MPRKAADNDAMIALATTLADHIKALRKKHGLSQAQLAERIGAHLTHVNRIETGKSMPGLDFLIKISRVFHVTLDDLIRDDADVLAETHFADKDLAERLRLLDQLDDDERQAIVKIIDAVLTKQRMRQVLEDQVNGS